MAHDLGAPTAPQIRLDLLERAALVLGVSPGEMPGHVRGPDVLVSAIRRVIAHLIEVAPERVVVILRRCLGETLTRPPPADGAGDSTDDETDGPAHGADRHAGRRTEEAASALAERLRIALHTRGRALPRRSALGLRQ